MFSKRGKIPYRRVVGIFFDLTKTQVILYVLYQYTFHSDALFTYKVVVNKSGNLHIGQKRSPEARSGERGGWLIISKLISLIFVIVTCEMRQWLGSSHLSGVRLILSNIDLIWKKWKKNIVLPSDSTVTLITMIL